MNNNKFRNILDIEELFREKFEDYKVNPSAGLWNRIYRKLIWKEFLTFNLTSFNGYYLTGILALSVAGILWITNPKAEINPEKLQDVVTVSEDQGESRELITTDIPSESPTIEDLSEKKVISPEIESKELTKYKTTQKSGMEETGNREPGTENREPATYSQRPHPVGAKLTHFVCS